VPDTHGEQHRRQLRPSLGEQQRLGVTVPDTPIVGEHRDEM
jgi:hypothetical protein